MCGLLPTITLQESSRPPSSKRIPSPPFPSLPFPSLPFPSLPFPAPSFPGSLSGSSNTPTDHSEAENDRTPSGSEKARGAMQEQRGDGEHVLAPSLSFRKREVDGDSPQMIPAVARELPAEEAAEADQEEEEEFEFTFAIKDPEACSPIAADEIFYDGRIRPIYPVFGRGLLFSHAAEEEERPKPAARRAPLRHLFIEDRESSAVAGSGSEEDEEAVALGELSGIPPDTYCLWTPGSSASASPSRCKKSGSTGSLFRWRFRDLVMGRSQSDGKEKFVFLATEKEEPKKEEKKKANSVELPRRRFSLDAKAPSPAAAQNGIGKGATRRHSVSEAADRDVAAARRSVGHAASEGGRQQSFLPYKQDLLGLFANVNGIRRTYRPF